MENNLELAFQAFLPALTYNLCKKPLALCSGHLLLSLFTVAVLLAAPGFQKRWALGKVQNVNSLWDVVGERKALQMCLEMFSAKCSLLDHVDYVEIPSWNLRQGFGSERADVWGLQVATLFYKLEVNSCFLVEGESILYFILKPCIQDLNYKYIIPGAAGSQDIICKMPHLFPVPLPGVRRQLKQFAAPVHLGPGYAVLQRCKMEDGELRSRLSCVISSCW